MQVYVLIHDGERLLVFKKQVTNGFWEWRKGTQTLVNQAGQWALPGGRVDADRKESATAAGMREVLEETGLDLKQFEAQAFMTGTTEPTATKPAEILYEVIAIRVPPEKLTSDKTTVTKNLTAGDDGKPKVRDWELASVEVVSARDVTKYLGVRVELDAQAQSLVSKAKPWTQLIDWYAEIAKTIIEKGLPTKTNTK